jgi:hypothetical protein
MIGTLAAILERGILFAAKKVEVEAPRQPMQLWPCKTTHKQYNSGNSELT